MYQEGFEMMKRKQERHIQYPRAFKLEVAMYAEHHSQLVTARTFNVSRKRVFEWLQLHRTKFAKGMYYEEHSYFSLHHNIFHLYYLIECVTYVSIIFFNKGLNLNSIICTCSLCWR